MRGFFFFRCLHTFDKTITDYLLMKYLSFVLVIILIYTACSSDSNTNPVKNDDPASGFVRGYSDGTSWYSNQITTNLDQNIRTIKSTQILSNDPKFSSSILELKVSASLPGGLYSIGENEPGYTYFVKAYYTRVAKSGYTNEFYKAYFDSVSYMTINKNSSKELDAVFNFSARTDDSTKFVNFTGGVIKINY